MQPHAISYSAASRSDLIEIGNWLSGQAGAAIAARFIDRIIAAIETLSLMPERHRLRPELGDKLRVLGFRRYLIFYVVEEGAVVVVRVLHSARDVAERTFKR